MKKILVVEDNPVNRCLLEEILQFAGYQVIIAENGEEGLEKAKTEQPDLILMDISMPIMDGFETARLIRNDPAISSIKMVAATSFAMKGDRERIMESGFDAYVSKPLDTRELIELVNKMIT